MIDFKLGRFGRNVITLMFGTVLAQAIPFIFAPLLTRIYSPSEFGLLGIYSAVVSIGVVFATGRYELAILLPKSEKSAFNLLQSSFAISAFVSLLLLLAIYNFGGEVTKVFNLNYDPFYLYFIPFGVFFVSISQILNYWHNRQSRYKELALARVYQSLSVAVLQFLFSFIVVSAAGLICGVLFGSVIYCVYLIRLHLLKSTYFLSVLSFSKTVVLLKKYRSYPLIDGPTTLLGVASMQSPIILLPILFNPKVAGFFFLAQKMLSVPITLISNAVLDVFKQIITKKHNENICIKSDFLKLLFSLSLISLLFTVFGFLYFVDLFMFVFGGEWEESGVYAELLIPALALRLIANPLSFIIYLSGRQGINLFCAVTLLLSILISLYTAGTPYDAVIFISLSFSVYYTIRIIISYILACVVSGSNV
ncbi:lipopolysaccharide biosynthesis protein [Pseudoalteromonas sp.]|uniref:lipopolysaccharide biosynthesis protein n=1 Tax=Pseudoalteromonas sp. TaxID=53249 RepID=UPI0025D73607|nr:lipopolysaccharide biosynthesis protein [Pseudoalteromonas sp.]